MGSWCQGHSILREAMSWFVVCPELVSEAHDDTCLAKQVVVTMHHVGANEELLADYGPSFWRANHVPSAKSRRRRKGYGAGFDEDEAGGAGMRRQQQQLTRRQGHRDFSLSQDGDHKAPSDVCVGSGLKQPDARVSVGGRAAAARGKGAFA